MIALRRGRSPEDVATHLYGICDHGILSYMADETWIRVSDCIFCNVVREDFGSRISHTATATILPLPFVGDILDDVKVKVSTLPLSVTT